MINNVCDHSQSDETTISITQNFLETRVVIHDDGVGIFNNIRNHFGYRTLEDAVAELFKGKLTTDPDNHSGEGIFFTSKLMDSFVIISSGKIFTNDRYDNEMLSDNSLPEKNGTLVAMSISNFSKRLAREVFDKFAGADGGFTRTIIPVKNMFETSPVSRSQAKRICNRLDKYEEVIIDFDGVEWMGQGFADQIFRIFTRDNPQTTLHPINMNEDVSKMHQHVIKSGV